MQLEQLGKILQQSHSPLKATVSRSVTSHLAKSTSPTQKQRTLMTNSPLAWSWTLASFDRTLRSTHLASMTSFCSQVLYTTFSTMQKGQTSFSQLSRWSNPVALCLPRLKECTSPSRRKLSSAISAAHFKVETHSVSRAGARAGECERF